MADNPKEVANFIEEMEKGGSPGQKLVLDSTTGKLVVVSSASNIPTQTEIRRNDAKMFGFDRSQPTLVLLNDEIDRIASLAAQSQGEAVTLLFQPIDGTDVFRMSDTGSIKGFLSPIEQKDQLGATNQCAPHLVITFDETSNEVAAFYVGSGFCKQLNIIIPPVHEEIYSRIKGIYETSILSNKTVLFIGLGSGGSPVALELVKQGVQNFVLVDHDKLETSNISRHICGISDLGRYKTKAVADMLRNKNPYANITTYEVDIVAASPTLRTEIFANADLVICGTDNRKSKQIVNGYCIESNKTCIYGGAFRRAYGGEVLRVIPHQTLCYQCYIHSLPEDDEGDFEVSNLEQAKILTPYSDTDLVAIEPGLSTDIAPISIFISKLAILELLKDQDHTLTNLYEDLSESLYIWHNRREEGNGWDATLTPLQDNIDNMSILRWYGIATERNARCSICGEFSIE